MTNTDVILKLIGPVNPIGETNTDDERYKNLEALCEVANDLFYIIKEVYEKNAGAYEFSVKRAGEYAGRFIKNISQEAE